MKNTVTYRITVPVSFEIEADFPQAAIALALEILRDTDIDFDIHSNETAACTSMGWPEAGDPEIGVSEELTMKVLATIELTQQGSRGELYYSDGDIYCRDIATGEIHATQTGATEETARQVIQQSWGQPTWDLHWGEYRRCRIYGSHPLMYDYPMGTANDYLFGELGGPETGYSREFFSTEEAENAIKRLLDTGDYGIDQPEFTVCDAE